MKKLLLIIGLLLALACPKPSFSQERAKDILIHKFLDTLTKKSFSGAILVAKNNNIIAKRAYGLANIELNVENRIDTKFNIASITKTFTATAILQLYEEGKVDLDTPIGKYLPRYPNERIKNTVTINHLLSHTAGTPNFYVTNFLDIDKFQFKKVEDFVPLFVKDTLLFDPGTGYNYDAAGYVILGLIIEKVSGKSYYDYLESEIFAKVGMNNTHAYNIEEIAPNKANGYTFQGDLNNDLVNNIHYISKVDQEVFIIQRSRIYFALLTPLKITFYLMKKQLK